MLIAKENTERIPPIEEGMYDTVCTMLVDMGVQQNPRFGTSSRKVRLVWDVLGQTVKIGDQEFPRRLSKEFTNSLSDKSNLRKALQSWRGKAFTEQELKGFDLRRVLGVGAFVQVIHKSSDNGVYANVETIVPLNKAVPTVNPVIFDLDDVSTYPVFQTLPRYMQEEIAKSEGFEYTGLQVAPKENGKQAAAPAEGYSAQQYDGYDVPPMSEEDAPPEEYQYNGFYNMPKQASGF